MNKDEYFKNFLDYSQKEDFSFLIHGEEFVNPKQMSFARRTGFKAMMSIGMSLAVNPGFGFLASQNSYNLSNENKEGLVKDMEKMYQFCDLVGIKLSNGPSVLRLAIDADDLTNESLIGRYVMIHEEAHNFRQYAVTMAKTRFSETKFGVFVQVLTSFSTHIRAVEFTEKIADKCRHSAFWKQIYTKPWVVDLEREDVKNLEPLGGLFNSAAANFKTGIFSKQHEFMP